MSMACCDDFIRLHSNIGRRGFAIRTGGQASLLFQAVPAEDEPRLAEALRPAKLVAQSMGRESIRYCPFCGSPLGP